MKTLTLFAVLVLLLSHVHAQIKPAIPTLLIAQLAQSKSDSARIRVLLDLADHYYGKLKAPANPDSVKFYLLQAQQVNAIAGRPDLKNRMSILSGKYSWAQKPEQDAKEIFLPIIDSCKKTRDLFNEQQAWIALGDRVGRDLKVAEFKISCYENAKSLAEERKDKNTEMVVRRYIADVHLQQRKFDTAESELLHILSESGNIRPELVMYTYDLLAAVHMSKGTYDKALQNALQTVKTMEAIGDSSSALTFFNRLSIIYRLVGKYDESSQWKKRELDYSFKHHIERYFRSVYGGAANLLNDGKPAEALKFVQTYTAARKPTRISDRREIEKVLGDCYARLNMFELAEKHFQQMIDLSARQTDNFSPYERADDNTAIGLFYVNCGKYSKARPFLEQALVHYKEYGILQFIKDGHYWLFYTDSAMGNYVSAIQHLQKSRQLRDSIFSVERNKQVEELHIAYKTEEKDKNLILLAQKEELARANLQYAESTKKWIIGGAVLLLIIAGLLYRQTIMRKRSNTIIKTKNSQLQHLLTEKEWLLKEVHHRVKNNLHTVIGLLESQAAYLQDDALKANEISKHRIFAMSLIHQQLYNATDIKSIDMSVYLPELADYLQDSFGTARQIRFRLQIEPIKLTGGQAIPIALIVNEAVTNSIKYAFPSNRLGTITINMHQQEEEITLCIADDGMGIDQSLTKTGSTSLGMKLMKGLTEDIDGNISIANKGGTNIIIEFKADPLNERSTLQAV